MFKHAPPSSTDTIRNYFNTVAFVFCSRRKMQQLLSLSPELLMTSPMDDNDANNYSTYGYIYTQMTFNTYLQQHYTTLMTRFSMMNSS